MHEGQGRRQFKEKIKGVLFLSAETLLK